MEGRNDDKRDPGGHNKDQDDSDEESEILEESPCGRWLKRREEVEQRNIPGIDATFLAMDTEEGVEVAWNEVILNNWDSKQSSAREEKIAQTLDRLIQLDHPNIVKLHKYWTDINEDKARVIFITEYMSCGSLKHYLKKTKRNVIKMALPAWKRWCTQMLSALCYLHSSYPPIIHGNLTCDTIFISHNGLIKIDAVAPNAIHRLVKSVREDTPANMHFVAPEIGIYKEARSFYVAPCAPPLSAAIDIFSFGICALEMAALEITSKDAGENAVITQDTIKQVIESLDNPRQKDFIRMCLSQLPSRRPSARKLLFHPVIFEVPSLRLLAAHVIVNTPSYQPEQLTEEALNRALDPEAILAEIKADPSGQRAAIEIRVVDAPQREVEKFFEQVRSGAYPLTALVPTYHPPIISRQRTTSPELTSESPENFQEEEHRRLANVCCTARQPPPAEITNQGDAATIAPVPAPLPADRAVTLLLKLDDKMNRQVSCELRAGDTGKALVEELVSFGLIHADDRDMVAQAIDETLARSSRTPDAIDLEDVVATSNAIGVEHASPLTVSAGASQHLIHTESHNRE